MSLKETILFLILIIIALLLIFAIFLLLKKKENTKDNSSKLIQDHLFHISKNLDEKISKNFEINSKISHNSNKTIEELTKKMTQLQEETKQIRDIWWQLEWLENILKNPKQRWNLWEYFLKELLENIFNEDQYKLEHKLWDWYVDAALFIWDKIIPIDSKFPHDNYEKLIKTKDETSIKLYSSNLERDIKTQIEATSKYIDTFSSTVDFAFMLIPAEWLYYDLFISKIWTLKTKKLMQYAFSKKVIICSPSSFYAYLQTVIQWLRSLKIEEKAKEILKHVDKLEKDLNKYSNDFLKIWKSLDTIYNHYNSALKRFEIIDKDILKISEIWEKNLIWKK